jgi:hypothetical protein
MILKHDAPLSEILETIIFEDALGSNANDLSWWQSKYINIFKPPIRLSRKKDI